jgi:hypothetical protein
MRDMNDFGVVVREAAWLLGCVAAAIVVSSWVEDKGNQTPFVAVCFYLMAAGARLALKVWRQRSEH